jgi:hypothetical protein
MGITYDTLNFWTYNTELLEIQILWHAECILWGAVRQFMENIKKRNAGNVSYWI